MIYESYLGGAVTQEKSFPFAEYISPSDYDLALRSLQKILEARWNVGPLTILNPFSPAWRYIGAGGDQIKKFLDRYIIYSRTRKDYIRTTTFMSFKNGLMGEYPVLQDDQLNEWLNAMITATQASTLPDSILKPYNYVPQEAVLSSIVLKSLGNAAASGGSKLLMYAVIGGTVYMLVVYGLPTLLKGSRHALKTRRATG